MSEKFCTDSRDREPILTSAVTSSCQEAGQEQGDVTVVSRGSVWIRGLPFWPKSIAAEVSLLLYSLYFAAAWPLSQQFIYEEISLKHNFTDHTKETLNCSDLNKSSPNYLLEKYVQSQSTQYMIYQNTALLFPSFFTTIFLGGYSDKGGRKYALIFPCIGAFIRCILCIIIVHFKLSLVWFLFASTTEGCFGGSAMMLMAAFSYVTDITEENNRSFRIILLECCLGVGIGLSQLMLGYIIHWMGYLWPFVILACLSCLDVLYITFCVPETLIPTGSIPILSTEHMKGTFRLYLYDNCQSRRCKLWATLSIVFLVGCASLGSSDVTTYHLLDYPLCWDSVLLGQYGAYTYGVQRFGGLLLTKFLQAYSGDVGLIIIGNISTICFFSAFAAASTTADVFLVPVAGVFAVITIGIVRAYNSKIVTKNELGAMYASIAWAELLAALVGSVSFNAIYKASLSWMPELVFVVIIALSLVSLIFSMALLFKSKSA